MFRRQILNVSKREMQLCCSAVVTGVIKAKILPFSQFLGVNFLFPEENSKTTSFHGTLKNPLIYTSIINQMWASIA